MNNYDSSKFTSVHRINGWTQLLSRTTQLMADIYDMTEEVTEKDRDLLFESIVDLMAVRDNLNTLIEYGDSQFQNAHELALMVVDRQVKKRLTQAKKQIEKKYTEK